MSDRWFDEGLEHQPLAASLPPGLDVRELRLPPRGLSTETPSENTCEDGWDEPGDEWYARIERDAGTAKDSDPPA